MRDTQFLVDDPQELGINPSALEQLLTRVRQEVDDQLLPSAQIAIARHGKLAVFETFGDADNNSLYCIFSATKAITSFAAWLLIDQGDLDVHRRVVEIIPEFGSHGKDSIRIEQLFTHTCGFPSAPFRPTDWNDKSRRLTRFQQWRLNWEPGSQFEYHPTSSMWVIAELIERISGEPFDHFVRTRVAEPLGLEDLYLGLPDSEQARVKNVMHVGEPLTSADYARLGVPEPPATEVTEDALDSFNLPEVRRIPVPGGGGIMSAAEIALFYQCLVHGGKTPQGQQLLQRQTLDQVMQIRSSLPDPLTGTPSNRGLGIVIAGDETRNFRGFGHQNSPQAFGHNGAGGQLAWADPATGISLGYVTNGHDRHKIRQGRRGVSISNRAAMCAHLTE